MDDTTTNLAKELISALQPELDRMIKEAFANAKLDNRDEWLNVKQAAEYLGWTVGTLYTKTKEVPCTKVGGSLRFSRKALDRYIKRENK